MYNSSHGQRTDRDENSAVETVELDENRPADAGEDDGADAVDPTAQTFDREDRLSTTVCIVGLGYVGLPLATAFDTEGFDVVGYDIDPERVAEFNDGRDPTGETGDDRIAEADIDFTDDPLSIRRADFVLITVPTPLDNGQNPELQFVKSATRTVAEHLSEGTTVVLESTVYPGVTRDVVASIIEEETGFTLGEEFNVGYSPERLSPGEGGKTLREAVKIVGGDTGETVADLSRLYGSIVDAGIYEAPTIETAEAAKVLENVQRDLNIALMNEMAIICDHLDLDTQEVIDAASTKWNFHDYTPGLVGGHCIPVDPLYLAHGSERAGFSPKLIFQGREVNEYMPKHLAELTIKALNRAGKVPKDSRLLVLGAAYKPGVGDIRTSEVETFMATLSEYDVDCVVHDPVADDEEIEAAFDVEVAAEPTVDGFDGVVLATPHAEFYDVPFVDIVDEFTSNPVFIDVDGAFDKEALRAAGYVYRRL